MTEVRALIRTHQPERLCYEESAAEGGCAPSLVISRLLFLGLGHLVQNPFARHAATRLFQNLQLGASSRFRIRWFWKEYRFIGPVHPHNFGWAMMTGKALYLC